LLTIVVYFGQSRGYAAVPFQGTAGVAFTFVGENAEREESIMYLIMLEQNRHCCFQHLRVLFCGYIQGKETQKFVQVITI
jgi:hypothetical protein